MSITLIALLVFSASLAAAGTGYFVGRSNSRKQIPEISEEGAIELRFAGHPERVLEQISRDLPLLADCHRLSISGKIQLGRGWTDLSSREFSLGWLEGNPSDAVAGVCDYLMDDDSPLIERGRSSRQNQHSHPAIFLHMRRGGTRISWRDSDSPIYVTLQVKVLEAIRPQEPPSVAKAEVEDEEAIKKQRLMLEAKREVEELERKQKGAMQRASTQARGTKR